MVGGRWTTHSADGAAVTIVNAPRLRFDRGRSPWCSMCGAVLTPADNTVADLGGWACQCGRCRTVLESRSAARMADVDFEADP